MVCFRNTIGFIHILSTIFVCVNSGFSYDKPQRPETELSDTLDVITKVLDLYDVGNIRDAEHQALIALDNPAVLSKYDKYMLYKVLAFCSIANEDEDGGVRRFVEALKMNPLLAPDPITWSPKVRRVFTIAKKEYKSQAEKIRLTRQMSVAEICRNASLKSLYLPGTGQISKGSRTKGLMIELLFFGAAATFVYSQITLTSKRDNYLNASSRSAALARWEDYRDFHQLRLLSGSLAASVYLYAFFDALWTPPADDKMTDNPGK